MCSMLKEEPYKALLEVFRVFEAFDLKGQQTPTSHTKGLLKGVIQKPNFSLASFKCLRALPDDMIYELLRSVANKEISLKELRNQAQMYKDLNCLKGVFISLTGQKSWDDVKNRYL